MRALHQHAVAVDVDNGVDPDFGDRRPVHRRPGLPVRVWQDLPHVLLIGPPSLHRGGRGSSTTDVDGQPKTTSRLLVYGVCVHATVARYFDAMSRHDWTELRSCLADGFSRVGPYENHAWSDPESYMAFLEDLLPTIEGQQVEVTRTIEDGSFVHVDATETIEVDGSPHAVRVAATFKLDDGDRIEHVEVFVRRFSTVEIAHGEGRGGADPAAAVR